MALALPSPSDVLDLVPLERRDWTVVLPLAPVPAVVGQALKPARIPGAGGAGRSLRY